MRMGWQNGTPSQACGIAIANLHLRPIHIVIVGAGAVGCFYASRLHYVRFSLICFIFIAFVSVCFGGGWYLAAKCPNRGK